jgi:hypothetical protein
MSEMPLVNKAKSFWEKPEGRTGMLFAAGGILGVIILMTRFGTILVQAAENTMVLIAYIAAILGIAYVAMDSRARATLFYAYKTVMRWITGMVIEIDPIAILHTYVDDLKKNYDTMGEQIAKLRGVIVELKRKIRENEQIMENSMSIANQAKKELEKSGNVEQQQRMKAQMMLKTRKAGRLKSSNRTFQELHNKIEMIYRVLNKMYVNCEVIIMDTEDSIEQKETEWKTIRAAHGAMRSAMSIINGNRDKRAIFEEALDIMANDLDTKVGEMERFMEVSQNFLDGVDLQEGAFEEKGMEMLEKWEKDADSWLLGDEKDSIIEASNDENQQLDVNEISTASPGTLNYKNLFNH